MSDNIEEIHVDDIGTAFRCTMYDGSDIVDISSSTSLILKFKRPDSGVSSKDASFYTDGTDGILQYTSVSGDLNIAGNWYLQAVITNPSGQWSSNISSFQVHENL